MVSVARFSSHHRISRSTHSDAAASGEAITISHADRANPYSIFDQSLGPAEMLVLSRKTRIDGRRYQRVASFSTPRWICGIRSRSRPPL